ncbi:MAG: transglutaminase family protein [Mesorhizobium sp.]|nr:transglutaminase family protein [Mesorhizobium sp.]
MLIRLGYQIGLELPQPTQVVTALEIHPDRKADLRWESGFSTTPEIASHTYTDAYGNRCRRFVAPAGATTIRFDAIVEDSGLADESGPDIGETPIADLPDSCIGYMLGSRYCETDHLGALAWNLFGHTEPGWARVQAITDYVHNHLSFGYGYARSTRTAAQAHEERVGVCRDFAHLAIAFCRCMNIPARYVNGYLGDINVPADPAPMDFSAWFEAYLGGKWYTFDARHNKPRTGRVVVARGRDATDVPLVHTFGPHTLTKFEVWTYEQDAERKLVRNAQPMAQRQINAAA